MVATREYQTCVVSRKKREIRSVWGGGGGVKGTPRPTKKVGKNGAEHPVVLDPI